MAAIVLVHGIDNQSESADLIENGTGCRRWRGACGWRAGGTSPTGSGPRALGPTRSSAGRRITAGCSARPTAKGPGRTPATGRRSRPPWPRPSPWNGSNTSPSVPPPRAPTPSRPASTLDIARDPAAGRGHGVRQRPARGPQDARPRLLDREARGCTSPSDFRDVPGPGHPLPDRRGDPGAGREAVLASSIQTRGRSSATRSGRSWPTNVRTC